MANNVVTVSILGNTRGLSRALNKARKQLGGLDRISDNLTQGFKVAGIAVAGVGIAAVGAAAVGTAAMLGLSAAVVGVGVAIAAQNEEVKSAFKDMADFVGHELKHMAEPFVPVLVDAAGELKSAFQSIQPTLTAVFESGADLLGNLVEHIEPLATSIADMLKVGFEASAPVLDAFVGSLDEVFDGLRDMFKELSANGGSEVFAGFAEAFNGAVGDLLVVIGQLARALAPLGTVILEVTVDGLERMGDYIEETLAPALEDMAYWIGENSDKVKAIVTGLAGLFVAIKVATVIGTLAGALSLLLTPAGLILGAIAGIALGLKHAWENSETFRDTVNGVITNVKEWWATNGQDIIDKVKEVWQGVLDFVQPIVDEFLVLVNSVITDIREWWAKNGEDIMETVIGTFNSIMEDVGPILEDIRDIIMKFISDAQDAWDLWGDDILAIIGGTFKFIMAVFRFGSTYLRGLMEVLRAVITGDWSQIGKNITATAGRLWDSVNEYFRRGRQYVVNKVQEVRDRLVAKWQEIKTNVTNKVDELIDNVLDFFRNLPGEIVSAVGNVTWKLYSAGRDIIDGFIDGITSKFQAVRDKLNYLTSLLPSWKGPASRDKRILMDAGELIMEGFQTGLESRYKDIRKSLGGFTNDLGKSAGADVPFGKGTKVSGAGGGTAVAVTVNVPPTADKAAVGKEIQDALDAWERRGRRRVR